MKKNKSPIYLKDYQASPFLIETVDLTFELVPEKTRVQNTMHLHRNPKVAGNTPLVLNGEKLQLEQVILDGKVLGEAAYELTETSLTIPHVPEKFTLTIVSTCNPKENTTLDGLYVSSGNFCTQCEPHGFRKITYYLDRPDVMASFTTTIIADAEKYPVLLSNGNCVLEENLANGLKKVTWKDPFKKPCYLFALVAGKLICHEDFFVTCSGRKITLRIFVEPGNETKTQHAMDMLKQAMRWDEEKYGREYDLDIFMIVAVADFNMGAMENKGLNIFNAKYILANPETATDADFEGIATVVAHEYFHNWTGNRITCRDWFQLSLKEGLTVFRDQEFTADATSRPIARIDDVRGLLSAQFPEDAGPLAHPVRPASYIEMNNFYTMTVYHKGAEVIRMLHSLEGEEGFRRGMDLYFDRFDGMAVTCDDFVKAHADANEKDYAQFMRWYDQAGTPQLMFSDHYDPKTKKYTLTVEQFTPPSADGSAKSPFVIPIRYGLYHEKLLKEGVLVLDEAKKTFTFENIPAKPIPSLMRNFSAPVKWQYPYTLEDQIFLLKHDADHFNRFEMAQQIFYTFALAEIQSEPLVESLKAAYFEALGSVLEDAKIDPAMKAKLLSLPSYRELSEKEEKIAVEKTIQARKSIAAALAQYLAPKAFKMFSKLKPQETYAFEAKAVGERSLKARCLQILLEAHHPEALGLLEFYYSHANNMTERYDAMHLLVTQVDPRSAVFSKLLQGFHDRYAGDALVMEKWLSLQAMVPETDTLTSVKKLMHVPEFDLKNPNKVRALIGTFSNQNFVGFHRPDGAGYEFLADQVLVIDKMNPMIAARLVQPLVQWKRYEDAHAVLMRSALQKIAKESLSDDLFELVDKSQ